ncbi:Protein GRIP [Acorus gramineus]|uniref:Protein GRIP n=1 Tax=Acorus gramineus TaxID=55184 RepID=A0AAV9B7E2_ACOGR|nr:Protein GRIP [Acorus gramineus]
MATQEHSNEGAIESGIRSFDGSISPDISHDELSHLVMELSLQNEYLKEHFKGLQAQFRSSDATDREYESSEEEKRLRENVRSLNREIQEQRETQRAAEDAMVHLRASHSEADSKVQELSAELIKAQQKMEQEIKERDDKYVELDSKFGRLLKRAKQRIQELQKEKDDLDAHINEITEQLSAQKSSMQLELERARQQASEALRSMDVERQQLRTANNKLRDNVDEMRRALEAKDNALESLQQSVLDKEQMLEDMNVLLQAMDDKRQALITELSAKHQKQLESLEAQLTDSLSERSKAAETISSLQILVGEKEARIAELDAASTGEAVRLGAAVEAAKGELAHLKQEHEKEKESWDAAYHTLCKKLEASESACLRAEIEAAKLRSQFEMELSTQSQLLNTKDVELTALRKEIQRIENEFSSYKVRAHALLQKKDAELSSGKNSELIKAQEEALKEAEREVGLALAERNKALQDLQDVFLNHDKEIAARDAALCEAEKQIRSTAIKLDSVSAQYLSEKETWQRNLENVEETWRLKCEALLAENNEVVGHNLQEEFEELKRQYKMLKEEHDSFRDIADRMLEEKEKELAKVMDENRTLHRSIESRLSVNQNGNDTALLKQDAQAPSIEAAESQILILARQQAQREEELAQTQRHILALQEEIEELERENRLHNQQEAMLKAELRNIERMQKRENVDMTYLKNVILKLLETGEVEALLPVVGMLLQFSPDEIKKCQQTYRASAVPSSPASTPVEASPSAPSSGSLFSRFLYS